jgi:hypothetical protein
MPGSQQHCVRLSSQLAQQVQACAEAWALPFAVVMRLAIQDLMQHPDRIPALVAAWQGPLVDTTTPEQRQRAEAYLKSLESVDLATLIGGMID